MISDNKKVGEYVRATQEIDGVSDHKHVYVRKGTIGIIQKELDCFGYLVEFPAIGTIYASPTKLEELHIEKQSDLHDLRGEYDKGCRDAWAFAKRCFNEKSNVLSMVFPCFDNGGGYSAILKMDVKDAMKRFKEWDDTQWNVGDEVIHVDVVCVLTRVYTHENGSRSYWAVDKDGVTWEFIGTPKKTGRHFDVSSLLKEISHEES